MWWDRWETRRIDPHELVRTTCLHSRHQNNRHWSLAVTQKRRIVAYLPTIPDSPELLRKSASNYGITARGKIITEIVDYGNLLHRAITGKDYVGEPAIRLFTAVIGTCAAAYRINSDFADCMRQVAAHSLRRLVSRCFIRCYPEIQRMGTHVMTTAMPMNASCSQF